MIHPSYIITTECEVKKINPENGSTFGLAELQQYVEGYIEVVALSPKWIMICNEEGVLLHQPCNDFASILASTPILGNVVVCRKEMLE